MCTARPPRQLASSCFTATAFKFLSNRYGFQVLVLQVENAAGLMRATRRRHTSSTPPSFCVPCTPACAPQPAPHLHCVVCRIRHASPGYLHRPNRRYAARCRIRAAQHMHEHRLGLRAATAAAAAAAAAGSVWMLDRRQLLLRRQPDNAHAADARFRKACLAIEDVRHSVLLLPSRLVRWEGRLHLGTMLALWDGCKRDLSGRCGVLPLALRLVRWEGRSHLGTMLALWDGCKRDL
eukprot:351082-Chlamydomonas_euryale.AAC.1